MHTFFKKAIEDSFLAVMGMEELVFPVIKDGGFLSITGAVGSH